MGRTIMAGSKEKKMEINFVSRRRVPLAMLAAFAAMSLVAQPALIEQGRAAISRGEGDGSAPFTRRKGRRRRRSRPTRRRSSSIQP